MKGTSSSSYFPAAALSGKSEQKLTAKKTINVHAVISQGSVQIKLRTRSSSSVKLPQPMSADVYGPFANYRSPQVSLHLHLNLVQHMPSKLVFLPIAHPVACAFSMYELMSLIVFSSLPPLYSDPGCYKSRCWRVLTANHPHH